MTAEYLLDAIGRVDDELIVEAAQKRRTASWMRWVAVAAAAALCVGLWSAHPLLQRKGGAAPAESESVLAEGAAAPDTASGNSALFSAGKDEDKYSVTQDVFKPVFVVDGTRYAITDFAPTLPEGCTYLGKLGAPDAPDSPLFVNDEAMAGRSVWRGADGELFVELSRADGTYARCSPMR